MSLPPTSPDTTESLQPNDKTTTRRDFLSLAWKTLLGLSGGLGLLGICRYFSYQPDPGPPTRFDLGLVEQFPTNSSILVPEAQAIIFPSTQSGSSDEEAPQTGFTALSLVCPHLGCIVELSKEGFACPCHGSQFYADGGLRKGPAAKSMRVLTLEIDKNAHLILDTSEE